MNEITLVLLPGLDGTGILFAPLLRHLPAWIRPVVISYPAGGVNSYEELIEHVDREVSGLEKFAVLGWSFGGPLALMLAARRAQQVSAVILCATFVTPPIPRLVPFRFIVVTPVVAVSRVLRRIRFVIPGFASPELRRVKVLLWKKVIARTLAARSRAALSVDARSLLKFCRAPLMYLSSTHDTVVRPAHRDEVIAIAPQTQLCEVQGSHLALFTNPDKAAEGIGQFLRQIIASPPSSAPVPSESVPHFQSPAPT